MPYTTYVLVHESEAEARTVFADMMARWPITGDNPSRITGWCAGSLMSVVDAVRLALESRVLDQAEQRDLALDLLELSSWEECLATFDEWDLAVNDTGSLVEKDC